MTQALFTNDINGLIMSNSSALPAIAQVLENDAYPPVRHEQFDAEPFAKIYGIHSEMAGQTTSNRLALQPLCYVRFSRSYLKPTENSSDNLLSSVGKYYDRVEQQLNRLSESVDQSPTVEKGAVDSALSVVEQLKKYQIAPPELSWHGGDAIVMLWSLGDTTFAITVTDGELGYVVRRNRKAVKMVDSIALDTFRLVNKS